MKVLAVFGTRPDAIKMAPVILELQSRPGVQTICLSTGQHREMLDQVMTMFRIKPDIDLNIMQHGQTLAQTACRALEGIDQAIAEHQPDIVLAQGDTTTTFAASLAAFYRQTTFGHVEAGLRTGNKRDPFPEEMNRLMTGLTADLHFAPTQLARQNLLNEGVNDDQIWVTGNTGIDAALWIARQPCKMDDEQNRAIDWPGRLLLVTAHRRENWGEPMARIADAVAQLSTQFDDLLVFVPMHRNPTVRETLNQRLDGMDRVVLTEPAEYAPFTQIMKRADLILTDSGGVQEEAPSFGVPVLVMRETTERPEGVEAGVAKLVGTDTERIVQEAKRLLTDSDAYAAMARAVNPYGDGQAAKRIADTVLR